MLIGTFAFRLTRARRMVRQYPWLYERTGLFTWQPLQPRCSDTESERLLTTWSIANHERVRVVREADRPSIGLGHVRRRSSCHRLEGSEIVMKSLATMLVAAAALAAGAGRLGARRYTDRRRRADDRPVRHLRHAIQGGRRAGGRRHQQGRRRARPEAGAGNRRRRLRSEAGGGGRQPGRRRRASSWSPGTSAPAPRFRPPTSTRKRTSSRSRRRRPTRS